MKKEEKKNVVKNIVENISKRNHFYLVDIATLNAEDTSDLRRQCFKRDVKLVVVKNTLLKEALKVSEGNFEKLYGALKGSTSIMYCDTGNEPAKLITDFRKEKKTEIPVLKAAYVEESIYLGNEELDALKSIKSKEELLGDVINILQSPAKNVISALQSGGNIIAGIVKTLSKK